MNRDNLIVDMESPTPIDVHRFSSTGVIDINISKTLNSRYYSLQIINSVENTNTTIDDVSTSLLGIWQLIEIIRRDAYTKRIIVNVNDLDSRTSYKKLTLANVLQEQELQEMLERQAKRMANTRRRMVVENKYHSRKTRSNITPRVLRPILREEKTW
jgi:hypothetical protein|tara:strand:+ start:760 stop:1230 length:471 start_codon:yes stop_codon:yes gene_type:complete